jgi:hypothetical protein
VSVFNYLFSVHRGTGAIPKGTTFQHSEDEAVGKNRQMGDESEES